MSQETSPGVEYDFEGAVQGSGLEMNDESSPAGEPETGHSQIAGGYDPPSIEPEGEISGEGDPAPQDAPEETSEEGEPLTEAEKQARHFQSLYDQAQAKLQKLEPYERIAQLIEQDPQVLSMIEAHLRGETPGQVSPEGRSEEEAPPQMPERPTKPAGFDPQEAAIDPDSDSAKYLAELAAWQDEYADWKVERDQFFEQQEQQTLQQKQEAAELEQARMQVAREAVQLGLQPNELQDFFQTMESPASRSTQNLVALYRLIKGQDKKQGQDPEVREQARKNEELRRKQESLRQPAASAPSNSSQTEVDENQAFGSSLAAHARPSALF